LAYRVFPIVHYILPPRL